MFKKYHSPNRTDANSNQSEIPTVELTETVARVSGYQTYEVRRNGDIIRMNAKLEDQYKLISVIDISGTIDTLVDLGCSNGAMGIILANIYSARTLYLLDHDVECVELLNTLSDWLSTGVSINPVRFSFGVDVLPTADIIVTLSTIHWFYSATADYGCLYKIIETLSKKVNRALIIEWVDPSDPAIQHLHHTSFNSAVHKTPYSKYNFLDALGIYFKKVQFVGNTTNTRELYVAHH